MPPNTGKGKVVIGHWGRVEVRQFKQSDVLTGLNSIKPVYEGVNIRPSPRGRLRALFPWKPLH